jgi:hypothetical protein
VQIRGREVPILVRRDFPSAAIVRQQQEVQELCGRFTRAGTSVLDVFGKASRVTKVLTRMVSLMT